MADAKPTGGGGIDWTSFEVIAGIIVLLAAINYMISGRSLFSDPSQQNPKTNTEVTSKKTCGLALTSPKSNENIDTIVNLAGKTDGCKWASTSDTAIYVQVVDGEGKPVSDFIKIPPINFVEGQPVLFSSTIGINKTPAKGTGYVILIPAQDDPKNPITFRRPIKFK